MRKQIVILCFLACFSSLFAQLRIPDANFSFELPNTGWKYLQTTKVNNNTKVYLYSKPQIVKNSDTVLPFLRIYVQTSNKNKSAMELSVDRFMEQPFQTLEEYTESSFIPTKDGIGYMGIYKDVEDGKIYQFYMLYFIHKNSAVEFRLQTSQETFEELKSEFEDILNSIVAY